MTWCSMHRSYTTACPVRSDASCLCTSLCLPSANLPICLAHDPQIFTRRLGGNTNRPLSSFVRHCACSNVACKSLTSMVSLPLAPMRVAWMAWYSSWWLMLDLYGYCVTIWCEPWLT